LAFAAPAVAARPPDGTVTTCSEALPAAADLNETLNERVPSMLSLAASPRSRLRSWLASDAATALSTDAAVATGGAGGAGGADSPQNSVTTRFVAGGGTCITAEVAVGFAWSAAEKQPALVACTS
jgi:hypothetical protein